MSIENPFHNPFMLGFDEIENMLLQITKGSESFPPYNIEQLSPNELRISLAVAGYQEKDLSVLQEDNQLIIRGQQQQDPQRYFLHRGIAARSFIKSFVLADGMKISGAFLENGLLNIDMLKPTKQKKVKRIAISQNETKHLLETKKGKHDTTD